MDKKLFYDVWESACKIDDKELFMIHWSDPRKFSKYKIDQYLFLKNMYLAAHMSMKDIMDKANLRICDVSYEYCIPRRTVEEWQNGRNKPPHYIRLLLIRDYKLVNLTGRNYKKKDKEKLIEQKSSELLKRSEEIRKLLEQYEKG